MSAEGQAAPFTGAACPMFCLKSTDTGGNSNPERQSAFLHKKQRVIRKNSPYLKPCAFLCFCVIWWCFSIRNLAWKGAFMTKDMTSGSPMKHVLSFTIPLIFGNLFQQFYSMVDTIIVGRLLGTGPLAAVGSTGSINFLSSVSAWASVPAFPFRWHSASARRIFRPGSVLWGISFGFLPPFPCS